MEIQKIIVEMAVGKESKEVVDVLAELIKDIRDGKKIEALMENMAGLLAAVEGYEQLDDEQKDESRHGTRAYLSMRISEAIEYKPVVAADPVVAEPAV